MKTFFTPVITFLLFLTCIQVNASHNAGGSIRYKSLGSNRYYVEVAAFRDCGGVQLSTGSMTVTAKCSSSSSTTNFTINHLPFIASAPAPFGGPYGAITFTAGSTSFAAEEISDVCENVLNPQKSPNSHCRNRTSTIKGFTRFRYSGIVTLAPCNYWTLGYSFVNGRGSSSSNASATAVYVETKFNNLSYRNNSIPFFGDERRPIFNACVGQIGEYHFGSNDLDGDSLTYKLVCARSSAVTCVNYRIGFSASSPVSGAKLDTTTGRFRFNPRTAGRRIIAVQVNEYNRCTGAWVGSTLRDVTMHAVTCTNNYPSYTYGIHKATGSATKLDSFRLKVKAGKPFTIEDTIYDPDTSDTLVLFSNHNEFFRGSTITTTRIARNKLHFKFSWTPPSWTSGVKVLHLTISDDRCNYPAKKRIGYHMDFSPSISISPHDDTLVLMKGDSVSLYSGGRGKVVWKSISGDSIRWIGSNKNTWGDTTSTDTNAKIIFRPLINTFLSASGRVYAPCKGFGSSDSIYIKVVPPFQIQTSPDTTVCSSADSVQISVTPDSSFTYTYSWSSDGGKISNKNISNPYVTARISGVYTVTVTSHFGGERVASVRINSISGLPKHDLISSFDSMCVGGSIKLEAKINSPINYCSTGPKKRAIKNIDSYDSLNVFNSTIGMAIYPNPLSMNNRDSRQEYLYRASNLKNQGLKRGVIQSIGFYIDSANSSGGIKTLQNYNLKLGCTTDTAVNSWTLKGLSNVATNKSLNLQFGWNVIPFDTGYYWDGTSSLRVQLCYSHNLSTQPKVITAMQKVPYGGSLTNYGATSLCNSQLLSLSQRQHIPVIRLGFSPSLDTSDVRYSWYPSSSFTSTSRNYAQASPRTTTTYNVAISDTFSVCRDTISKTVVIIPLQLDAGNDTTICNGASLTLNPSVAPNNNGDYTWFPASLFVNNKIKNPTLRVLANNTIWVSYKDSLGCSRTDTILVSSKANPDPGFSTKLKFCETETTNTLSAVTSGGVFIGSGVSGSNFNAADPSNKPGLNTPKNVTIFHSVTQNGCKADTTITVQVFPVFDTLYSGNRFFCELDSLEPLSTRHNGGFWSGNGVNNDLFNPVVAGVGTHTIRVDSSGFCGNSATYSFEVFDNPDHDFPDTVYGCDRRPVTLDAGNPGSTYLWNTGASSQTIKPTSSGKYWVNIKNGNMCEITDSTYVKITEICLGISGIQNQQQNIKVFPNPVEGHLNVISDRGEIEDIKILSINGQLIKKLKVHAAQSRIDLLDIASGTYFLEVYTDNQIQSFVIVVNN